MAKAKVKSVFFCKDCGYESPKWMGQCPACKAWNTMTEEIVSTGKTQSTGIGARNQVAEAKKLSEINIEETDRINSGMAELDRVLGGGIVPGSLVLVGGDPGIGKSTLLLQTCRLLSNSGHQVLYISGEESLKQIKMRAERLGSFDNDMELLCETDLTLISGILEQKKPEIVIIDSIQTMFNQDVSGSPGSVSQVRESTAVLLQLSKNLGISIAQSLMGILLTSSVYAFSHIVS